MEGQDKVTSMRVFKGMAAWRLSACVMVVAAVAALGGCGGGGAGKATSASPSSGADDTHGALSLGLSGGAARGVSHVWVTVNKIALHAQASQPWSASDRSWTVLNLSTPVVVDLAVQSTSSQGDVTPLFNGLSVPAGSYAQIRLFPLAHDVALDAAASAKGLSYNAEVDYTDGANVARVVPLELTQPDLGWRLPGAFSVNANGARYIVVEADLQHSLVRMSSPDGVDHFSFRPVLQSYDMVASGAIIGALDAAYVCGGASAPAAPNCAQDIIVSAQRPSADGQRHVSVRQYKVGSSGGFALFPLPSDSSYDVVITGRRMQTMVIKGVSVSPNAVPTASWTVLGSSAVPLQPVITPAASRSVNLASAILPGASALWWGQAVEPGGKPYEVTIANADPLSGVLAQALPVPDGPVSVATFVQSSQALSFVDTTPQEGSGAFSVLALGTSYDDVGAMSVHAPAPSVASTIAVSNPVRMASLGIGQIQVSLTGALSPAYDRADLIVSDVNGIVLTQAVTAAGNVVLNVPAGSQAASLGGTAVYSVALRAAGQTGALRWVRATAIADLRSSTSASLTLALP